MMLECKAIRVCNAIAYMEVTFGVTFASEGISLVMETAYTVLLLRVFR